MSLNHPYVSEGYAPAYQVSAIPFVTSSTLQAQETKQISLEYVSKSITIKNTGASGTKIAMAFTLNGLKPGNSNFFDIVAGDTPLTLDLRTTEIFLSASVGTPSFSFLAGCTAIHKMHFTTITGSNGYPGVG
jgi:hypothetical protein